MFLDREEFAVTYDPKKATPERLIATIKDAGYTAQIVAGNRLPASDATPATVPQGFPLLDEALAQAKREQKLIVLDFSAKWCAPCKQMERTTFADPKVKTLLERCVLVKIDTDRQPEMSQRLGVVGLPDIRFVSPDGKVIHRLRGFQNAESFAAALMLFIQAVERQ